MEYYFDRILTMDFLVFLKIVGKIQHLTQLTIVAKVLFRHLNSEYEWTTTTYVQLCSTFLSKQNFFYLYS